MQNARMPQKRKPGVGESLVSQIKEGPPAFAMVHDIRDPWAEEQKGKTGNAPEDGQLASLEIRDPWAETEKKLGTRERAEMPKRREMGENFAARIAELRVRIEDQANKYHRGDVALRPRGTAESKPNYLDRISRLGGIGGNRPAAGAAVKEKSEPAVPKEENKKPETEQYWKGNENLRTLNIVPKKRKEGEV